MDAPLSELDTQVQSLRSDLEFIRVALQLRPRLGGMLDWKNLGQDAQQLATQFMGTKFSQPEDIYGALLVRLMAGFERFLRALVARVVTQKAAAAKSYDDIAETLGMRNLVLTGRLLGTLDDPRDHLMIDPQALVENLVSCKKGNRSFKLNTQAFSATVTGVTPKQIDNALKTMEKENLWDLIGADPQVRSTLGTPRSRETGNLAKERLKELSRLRNEIAHAGDRQPAISEARLSDAINLVYAIAGALQQLLAQAK